MGEDKKSTVWDILLFFHMKVRERHYSHFFHMNDENFSEAYTLS